MSVYKKLAEARKRLAQSGIKKSGKNKYSDYEYLSLEDFLPELSVICAEVGIVAVPSFTPDVASLTIIDVENPDPDKYGTFTITSPMSTATLKASHAVQNLGAVETYLRRYLYMAAFEIVENDPLDGGKPRPEDQEAKPKQETKSKQAAKPKQEAIDPEAVLSADQNRILGTMLLDERGLIVASRKSALQRIVADDFRCKPSEVLQKDFERLRVKLRKAIDALDAPAPEDEYPLPYGLDDN